MALTRSQLASPNTLLPDEVAALMAGLQAHTKDSFTLQGLHAHLHRQGMRPGSMVRAIHEHMDAKQNGSTCSPGAEEQPQGKGQKQAPPPTAKAGGILSSCFCFKVVSRSAPDEPGWDVYEPREDGQLQDSQLASRSSSASACSVTARRMIVMDGREASVRTYLKVAKPKKCALKGECQGSDTLVSSSSLQPALSGDAAGHLRSIGHVSFAPGTAWHERDSQSGVDQGPYISMSDSDRRLDLYQRVCGHMQAGLSTLPCACTAALLPAPCTLLARQYAENIDSRMQYAKRCVQAAQEQMKATYDKGHVEKTFNEGDMDFC